MCTFGTIFKRKEKMKLCTFSGIATAGKTTLAKSMSKEFKATYLQADGLHKCFWPLDGIIPYDNFLRSLSYTTKLLVCKHKTPDKEYVFCDNDFFFFSDMHIRDEMLRLAGLYDIWKNGIHFFIFLPFEEYCIRRLKRDGIHTKDCSRTRALYSKKLSQLLDMKEINNAVEIDGMLPLEENIIKVKNIINSVKS